MTGHHHLLLSRAPYGTAPADEEMMEFGNSGDETHIHYGGGQTETVLDLPRGIHAPHLLLGDLYDIPHNPLVVFGQITIVVE